MIPLSVSRQSGPYIETNKVERATRCRDSISLHRDFEANDLSLMEKFLIAIEKRGYAVAYTALGHREDALDVVQETMLQLVRRYRDKTEDEWKALFYRILHNKINDTFRKRKLTRGLFGWLPQRYNDDSDQENTGDPFEQVPSPRGTTPDAGLEQERQAQALQTAIAQLPRRQREAFVLRCWEGFSTTETASTMGCSEGSVKTHYSRAMSSLRNLLEAHQQ